MAMILAHPWLSFALAWLGLGCWVVLWMWAANPYRRPTNATRTGSRWTGSDAE